MANTTNLDLVKPAGTDHALISVLNSNSDKIDAFAGQTNDSLSAEQNGLAYIVGNTNTTGGTLAVGQFVYVKGHSTIAEGLRKVTSSISNGGSITTNNTEACSEGGLNSLFSNLTSLSDHIANIQDNPILGTKYLTVALSDMNDARMTGIYTYGGNTANSPLEGAYGNVFVFSQNNPYNAGSMWVYQIAFTTDGDNKMYLRNQINHGNWSAWRTI